MTGNQRLVDGLIAYWSGDPELDANSRRRCRELTASLMRTLPPLELAAARRDPGGHRRSIERWVEALIPSREAHRNFSADPVDAGPADRVPGIAGTGAAAPPTATPAPSGGGVAVQTVSGAGNLGFNVAGTVTGPVQLHAASPAPPPAPSARAVPAEAGASATPESDGPIRILFLGANPTDGMRLRLDQEVREIDQALRLADLGARFELWQKWAVRPSDLQAHLLRHRPDILHFSGHGEAGNAILLEADDGATRPVEAARLARLLAQFNRRLRCVFLNACFSEAQAPAIAREVDCVIGMSQEVLDRAAIRFAANFYQALAFGCSVKAAFELCRADIEVGEMHQDSILQLLAVRCDPDSVLFVRRP